MEVIMQTSMLFIVGLYIVLMQMPAWMTNMQWEILHSMHKGSLRLYWWNYEGDGGEDFTLGCPTVQPILSSVWLPSLPKTEGTCERTSLLVRWWWSVNTIHSPVVMYSWNCMHVGRPMWSEEVKLCKITELVQKKVIKIGTDWWNCMNCGKSVWAAEWNCIKLQN